MTSMKKYCKPTIKVTTVEADNVIAASPNTTVDGNSLPIGGGLTDDAKNTGGQAKGFNIWDDNE